MVLDRQFLMRSRSAHDVCWRLAQRTSVAMVGVATASALVGGRWHSPGREVLYASISKEAVFLESLSGLSSVITQSKLNRATDLVAVPFTFDGVSLSDFDPYTGVRSLTAADR